MLKGGDTSPHVRLAATEAVPEDVLRDRINDDDLVHYIKINFNDHGSEPVKLLSGKLALTLLTRGEAKEWTPYDGPSFAMITRQSFRIGEGDPR